MAKNAVAKKVWPFDLGAKPSTKTVGKTLSEKTSLQRKQLSRGGQHYACDASRVTHGDRRAFARCSHVAHLSRDVVNVRTN